jgi:hypothetical protein
MAQPFLTMRVQSTSHSQLAVFTETNGVLVQVGEDFGTIERNAIQNDDSVAYNRVANWNGALYAAGGSGIWKYDPETSGPWTQIHTFATTPSTDGELLGLMPTLDGDKPVLVTAYPSTASNAIFVHIDEDEVVTEKEELVILGSTFTVRPNWMCPVAHKGKIYWFIGESTPNSNPVLGIYDVANSSYTYFSLENVYTVKNQICVHNDRLYAIFLPLARTTMALYELQASQAAFVTTVKSNTNNHNDVAQYQGAALASIDDKMVAIFQSSVDTGGLSAHEFAAFVIELDNDGVATSVTDVSNDVDPGIPVNTLYRFTYNWKVDTVTTPGSAQYVLEHSIYSQEQYLTSNYLWNGSGVLMTDLGPGKNAWQHSRTTISEGSSGSRIWHGSGTLQVSAPKFVVTGSDVDVDFVVYGANKTCALGIMYDKKGEACETPGTITQTNEGSIEGIYASGILATPGGTPVRVRWDTTSDGIISSDVPKVAGRIFLV